MTKNEITEALKGRDTLFNIFSQVFIDVPDEKCDKLVDGTYEILRLIAKEAENESVKEGIRLLETFYGEEEKPKETLPASRLERSRAYTSLFLLPGKHSASPHESVHLSPERLFKQEPWSEVKAFYQQNGFILPVERNMMEDHISIELQFMALLSGKAAQAAERGDDGECGKILSTQLTFYNEHILKWIPQFCDQVAMADKDGGNLFYAGYALFLKGFIEEDSQFLKDILGG